MGRLFCLDRDRAVVRRHWTLNVTTQVDRLKVDRLKEKTLACAAAAGRLAGDCVMDDHCCPSAFSLQPKHLSSYHWTLITDLIPAKALYEERLDHGS